MSLSEVADRIAESLRSSAALLHQLHDGLVRRRTAWIAARPDALQEPAQALERVVRELQAEAARREELLEQARRALPQLPGPGRQHVDTTVLCRHLPPAAAARLQQQSRRSTEAANAVRVELALGERLLRFTARAHEGLLAQLSGTLAQAVDDVGGYDRTARRLPTALRGGSSVTGSLIDGRM
jgi:hypothetical protein